MLGMEWEARMSARAHERQVAQSAADQGALVTAVKVSIPPPLAAGVCGHGIRHGEGGAARFFAEGGGWAGGVGQCECCLSPYVWTSRDDFAGLLCRECGGNAF